MSVSDPIADMLTCIRNASAAGKETLQVPHSGMKSEMARLLKRDGFIRDYTTEGGGGKRVLRIYLKYQHDGAPVIQGIKRISTPGRRAYVSAADVPRVLGGIGVAILSTSSGIMTDRDARRTKTGGEVLCEVW
jgi:small subunit ribosomal protein S8